MAKTARMTWDEAGTALANARRGLPLMVSGYFARGRKVAAGDPSQAGVRRLLATTGRLRHTIELFRPCYGPGLDTRLALLQRTERLIEEVQASAVAGRAVSAVLPSPSPQRERIESVLRKRAAAKLADFRQHWTEVFDAPGQEQWWTGYLARNVRAATGSAPRVHKRPRVQPRLPLPA